MYFPAKNHFTAGKGDEEKGGCGYSLRMYWVSSFTCFTVA